MPKIVKNGTTYTADAAALTDGSLSIQADSEGILELKAGYVKGNSSTGAQETGVFMIYSGDNDPSPALGKNGDIYLKKISS